MKIILVSGFLGSGKTRFIKSLVEKTDKSIVILENEFGDLNLDSDYLKSDIGDNEDDVKVWELTNGCICCSTNLDFTHSILTIANTLNPDYLIVEPSGVAKINNIIEKIKKISYERIELGLPILIIDAKNYENILENYSEYVKEELMKLLQANQVKGMEFIDANEIADVIFTSATELEFWVKTPSRNVDAKALSVSQKLQEQYWQRTHGSVRTALEKAVSLLDKYGLHAEMGHKEVGGVKAKLDDEGNVDWVLEQLEIDWKYTNNPLQTADNELQARIIVREVFRENGLDVTFNAKPIIGVAGSGEHTHFGVMVKMKNGKVYNLFSPADLRKEHASPLAYGAIMGLLKHYEAINPFISSTTDSLNRLKPGFEAPVCIVTSLGTDPALPSRNRTILCGLIRDVDTPMATRFELRSPNPYTNTYTALALIYLSAFDGMKYVITSGKAPEAILAELSKKEGEAADYLEASREYRSEVDVFDDFTAEERDRKFGKAPATVWENIQGYTNNPEKVASLTLGGAFEQDLMDSFMAGILKRWSLELANRIVPANIQLVRSLQAIHDVADGFDSANWNKVNTLRLYLAKDSVDSKSLFTRITDALAKGDYDTASALQVEMNEKVLELEALYAEYTRNIL